MVTVDLILAVLALVCFLLVAAGVPSRVNLTGLGLALWVLTAIL